MNRDVQFNSTIWIRFQNDNTIIYELWFFFKIIAFLRVYFNSFANFKFIIFACILQFDNIIYNRIFISITTAFIKFNKNLKIRKKIKTSIKVTNNDANNENKNDFNDDDYDFSFFDNILNVYQQWISWIFLIWTTLCIINFSDLLKI